MLSIPGKQQKIFQTLMAHRQSSHLAYTGTATGYCGDFYSQSGKIKDYILSFQSLSENIHQGKYVFLGECYQINFEKTICYL